jgi:hypothetical protein
LIATRLTQKQQFQSLFSSIASSMLARYRFAQEAHKMRFWIGLLLGLIIGAGATVGYYEFWNPGVEEPMEGSDVGDK